MQARGVDWVSSCVSSICCGAAWNDEDAMALAELLDRAAERDGPVGPPHGLPITVKDWIDVAELPCTGGYRRRCPRNVRN
jgi:Asp-tRNA(Asn)/Glu-tRNA(Gln) amidotransferase A subunit family amidase